MKSFALITQNNVVVEKEITKSSLKEMKAKNDSFIKTVFNLTESYSKRNNDYTNTQVNEVKILI